MRQLHAVELERHIATVGDLESVVGGVREIGEQRAHLFGRFEIVIFGLVAHASGIVDGLVGLNADQNVVDVRIGALDVMNIVGDDQPEIILTGEFYQSGDDDLLIFEPMILYLEKKIVATEDVNVLPNDGVGAAEVVEPVGVENGAGDFSADACRQRNQAAMILAKKFLVNPRLVVEAFGVGARDQFDEIMIALIVFGEQDQMIVLNAVDFLTERAMLRSNVDFAAYDGFDDSAVGRTTARMP